MKHQRVPPGRGRESVWDYPRPPRVEECERELRALFAGEILAETRRARRVLETSHPPVYYFPPEDVRLELLRPERRRTRCEWKGEATWFAVVTSRRAALHAAWTYRHPPIDFDGIRDWIAFYPHLMDLCLVDGEPVQAQLGDFFGGWVTSDIIGPFSGLPEPEHR